MNCTTSTATKSSGAPITLGQPAAVQGNRKNITIGLPRCSDPNELRFPLTPEGVSQLVEMGLTVKMQEGAAATIHYPDSRYEACGARITDRAEALMADIVICLGPLTPAEIRGMRRGALLLTGHNGACRSRDTALTLLERSIITIALDLIEDQSRNTPFADILSEIDGRAAIAIASSLLADPVHGKGILLGGVAGIVPCEVTVIGSGIAACAAARSASGAGAMVRMFDNDVYRLREAERELGSRMIGSSIHPKVLASALRSADVVIMTDISSRLVIGADAVRDMKSGVIIFDLSSSPGVTFPSLPSVDLASAAAFASVDNGTTRVCYINAGSAVPRTAAMGLSNALITLFGSMITYDGITNALKLDPGLQRATLTFLGKAVNSGMARTASVRHVDLSIFLTLS